MSKKAQVDLVVEGKVENSVSVQSSNASESKNVPNLFFV